MAKTPIAQQHHLHNGTDEHQKEIIQILRDLSRTHGLDRTWSDWVEMGALAMANAVDRAQFDRREKRYLEIVGHYKKEEVAQLAEAFAHLVQCWDGRAESGQFGDVLGSTFMMLDMGNAGTGQYFTPYEVSRMMSGIIMGDRPGLAKLIGDQGFVRVSEPTCGAGGMIIAAAHALHDAGINYQQAMHVTAIDIDRRCVHMAYLQLAMLHVPAVVVHGNALSLEEWGHWYTPAHILGGWGARLRQREAVDATRQPTPTRGAPGEELPAFPMAPVSEPSLPALSKAARKAAEAGQMMLF